MVHQPDITDGGFDQHHPDPHTPAENIHLGKDCENHIDRLVRERLEKNYAQRTNLKQSMAAANAHSWSVQGRFEQFVQSTFLCTLTVPGAVFGKAYDSGAQCSKQVIKAMPQVVNDDSDDDDEDAMHRSAAAMKVVPRSPLHKEEDDFRDIIATPVASRLASRQDGKDDSDKLVFGQAAREGGGAVSSSSPPAAMPSGVNNVPLPPAGAVPSAVAPLTAVDAREEDAVGPLPNVQKPKGRASRGGRKPGDTASALSVSSNAMTSNAAHLLGGFSQPGKVGGGSSQASRRKSSEERSVIGGSAASSSVVSSAIPPNLEAGAATSAGTAATASSKDASESASVVGGAKRGDGAAGPRKRVPGSGDSKTVIGGFNSNSQASALLGGLMNQNQGKKKTSKSVVG